MNFLIEHDILSKLEVLYQHRNIQSAAILIGDDVNVDICRLERMLCARNFPIGHSLFIIKDVRHLIELEPDLLVMKTNDDDLIDEAMHHVGKECGVLIF